MKIEIAAKCSDAIVSTNHPRCDYRTEEAKRYVAWIEKHLKQHIEPGKTILDLGCGSGKQTFALEALGLQATGIDCSTVSMQKAQEVADSITSKCEFVIGDYTKLPFQPNSFDYALLPQNLIECSYAEYEQLIDNLPNVLKPNGKLFLTMRQDDPQHYDIITGRSLHPTVTIPNVGTFDYPTYYWSISFMHHITSKKFELRKFDCMDQANQKYLFVYNKR
ncbi:MAG: class I SAM-dependent methyltransferase [Sedimentisphaerales bacterium]|nr:class I SAM-dependent methyltransferase [Sedimentisphaerales bacterium]